MGAEAEQPLDLRVGVAAGGDQVRVAAILARCGVVDRLEPHTEGVRGRVRWRPEVLSVVADAVAQCRRPEPGHPLDVADVEDPLTDPGAHGALHEEMFMPAP